MDPLRTTSSHYKLGKCSEELLGCQVGRRLLMDSLCGEKHKHVNICLGNKACSACIVFWSMPVYVNGLEKETRLVEISPINCVCTLFYTLQEFSTAFTRFLILGMQYFDRMRQPLVGCRHAGKSGVKKERAGELVDSCMAV